MHWLKLSDREAEELSAGLRSTDAGELRFRRVRVILGLSMLASVSLGVVGPYQMGIIKHLPEPPLPKLNADKVDASPEAYSRFSTPDAVLGLGSYAVTMILAAIGPSDRAKRYPWMPLMLAAKVAYDSYNAGILTVHQWTRHKGFCSWCLIAASATFAILPLAIPETGRPSEIFPFSGTPVCALLEYGSGT
jgi:uncharacterized membrane protein